MKKELILSLDTIQKMDFIRQELKNCNGRFFTVSFVKKDGSARVLTGRLGVKTPLVGGVNTVSHIEKYLTVWDSRKKEYRNVNLQTVTGLHYQGKTIIFEGF